MIATCRIDYPLPPELIAQHPLGKRDASRLLVVHRASRRIEHRVFSELAGYLNSGDILFRNNASVLPARLKGNRPTGGAVECLLLRPAPGTLDGAELWSCLVRPGRKLGPGATFQAAEGLLSGTIVEKAPDGTVTVALRTASGASVVEAANRAGEVPLPPYIERADATHRLEDRSRYQTVYADGSKQVAVAAPTAGLHFTPELLDALASAGVATRDLTLHVGMGTFKPIATETVEEHPIHSEVYEIGPAAQASLFSPGPGRRVAVGTTTVRSIEDFMAKHPGPMDAAHVSEASLYIYPPRTFRGVDALVTNFHQPRSTLLCLVAAFLTPGSTEGIEWLMDIYAEAIRKRYRFLSYGDAMLVL